MLRALLFFGIRNDISIIKICHYGNLVIKMVGVGFNFLDIMLAE